MFNYNHLYYFYVAAKQGGVTNAAKVLKIAQPSLSAQIKTLEGELNLSLFYKVGRRLVLTPDGERAFVYCRKIFEPAEEFSDYLKHSDTRSTHRCRIGVTREIERPFIADILSNIVRNKEASQQPFLSMSSDHHGILMANLRSGELDAVVTNHPASEPEVKVVADLSMPVVAVAAPHLIKKLGIRKKEALPKIMKDPQVRLVLPSDRLKIRIETDLFLQKLRLRNQTIFESDILSVVLRSAIEGVGVAFLPEPYIQKEFDHKTLLPLGNSSPLWQHSIFMITRNTNTPDAVVNEIQEYFLKLGAKGR
jgi:LysR family transcriptional activator of nhaA